MYNDLNNNSMSIAEESISKRIKEDMFGSYLAKALNSNN